MPVKGSPGTAENVFQMVPEPTREPPRGLQRALTACATALAIGSVATAQTPKLDDPQRSLFRAFPAADGYRVIERKVATADRIRIEKRVPFRLHYDDVGRHSLYVALRGRRPIGMIFVQREASQFGLTAVEWALTFDLQITEFRFQNARSPHRRKLERSTFVRSLSGKRSSDLAAMLDEHGRLTKLPDGIPAEARDLATAVVRSGVKAMAVLDVVWREEVDKLHDFSIGMRTFPDAWSYRRLWPRPTTAGDPAAATTRDDVALLLQVYDRRNGLLGVIVELQLGPANRRFTSRWAFDADLTLQRVHVPSGAPRALGARCRVQEGRALTEICGDDDVIGQAMQRIHELLHPAAKPGR